jgi:vitamin B12 transporter
MHRACTGLICLGLLLGPAFDVLGQNPPPTLAPVVVTATRTAVPLSELGVSATVITSEEIEARHAVDVLDLLRDVTGVNVSQSGSRGGTTSLYPRGGEDNYTLVLIDGVQVNQAGGAFDFANLDTDNIDRIEIIRGPQSALYGSDAIGGVIHIITKRGRGKPLVRASTSHGAHSENGHYVGEQKISLHGGTEQMGYSLAYGRVDDQGILDINNDYFRNLFSGRLDLYPLDTLDFTFTGRLNDNHFAFPTENGGDRPDRVFPGLDPDQFQDNLDAVGSAQARYEPFPWWEHVLQLSLHRLDQTFKDPPNPTATAFDAPPGSKTDSLETRATVDYHMNLRFPREGAWSSILTLGYEYERETLDLDSVFTTVFGPAPFGSIVQVESADQERTNQGYYLQEQIALFDRLHLTGGFRVEDNSEFGLSVNPRGSIAVEIPETGTTLRGAAGTGIKEPTFLENFGGFGVVGNPDLQPEKSLSWEVGIDQRFWEDRLELGLTYFQNRFDDMITFVSRTPPAVSTFENIQKAESWGLEFTTTVRPGYGLAIGAGYTFLHTEVLDDGGLGNLFFRDGEELLRRPNHSASFYVDWLWEGFNVRLNGTYVGERDDTLFTVAPGPSGFYDFTTQRLTNDAYFVLDLAASYTFADLGRCPLESLKIFVKGHNILDEDYEEVLGFSSPRLYALGGIEVTF